MSQSGSRCDDRRRGPNLCLPTLGAVRPKRPGRRRRPRARPGSVSGAGLETRRRPVPTEPPSGAQQLRLIHGRVPNEDPLTGRPPASAPIHNASARRAAGRVPGWTTTESAAALVIGPAETSRRARTRAPGLRLVRSDRLSSVAREAPCQAHAPELGGVSSRRAHRRAKRIREAQVSTVAGDTLSEDRARIPLNMKRRNRPRCLPPTGSRLTADERVAARILRRASGQQEGVQEWLSSGYRW
jgi:hypothetical protein